jgi:hypothetical protein
LCFFSAERCEDWPTDVDNRINYAITSGKERGFIKSQDVLVVITGWRQGMLLSINVFSIFKFFFSGAGFTNTVRIVMAP